MTHPEPRSVDTAFSKRGWFEGRIPIVLGTVGHRDFSARKEKIIKAVRKECRRLKRTYRNSPFLILSGLAEGADRIVAKIVMEELGAKLIAVLPFPESEFCEDFATQTSRDEFSKLLKKAAAVFEIPPPEGEQWRQNGQARDAQYARVGAVIAEQSQILLALWDGKPARGLGGTADVVEWFQQGYAPRDYSAYKGDISLFDPPQPGLLIRIDPLTGEQDHQNGPDRGSAQNSRILIRGILKRTESYNRDLQRDAAQRVTKASLVPTGLLTQTPIYEASNAFREADALSIYYAKRVRLADWVLYALALTTVFAFGLVDVKPLASWSFLSTMGVMAIVYIYVSNLSLDAKYQEYRSFAEAMRILFFWRMLGLRNPVWLSYLSKHGAVVRWLKHAVRAVEFAQDQQLLRRSAESKVKPLYDTAIKYWLDQQVRYFTSAANRHWQRYIFGIWIVRASIVLTFATSIVLAVMTLKYGDGLHAWRSDEVIVHPFGTIRVETFIQQLQIAVSLTAAMGIAARGFLGRTADLELAKQYSATLETFQRAEIAVRNVADSDMENELPDIFERLGREALLEQADWHWIRHSRPFEAPT